MRTLLLVIPLAAVLAAGCASASAKAPVERPALNVPPPPPRIIEAAPEPEPEPVGDLPSQPSTPPVTRPNRSSREPGKNTSAEAKPEAKPEAPKPPETTAPPPEPAPVPIPPAAQLRTPQTADASGAAKNVQATIDRARGLLNGVNYAPLSDERKKAYNDAKRFNQQAEEALRQGNYVFAQSLASKAETLAKELAGK